MISFKNKTILLTTITLIILALNHSQIFAETVQERVHHMSHDVMPFDIAKTIHVFVMTESGGVQKVLARDKGDNEQIMLIRQHIMHEAQMFGHGNYSDPTKLHGEDMPGIAELRSNPSKIKVSYSDLPAGAQLTFETKDLTLLTAIHRWFGAQLSEHGTDAMTE